MCFKSQLVTSGENDQSIACVRKGGWEIKLEKKAENSLFRMGFVWQGKQLEIVL